MVQPAIDALEADYEAAAASLVRATLAPDADSALVDRITAGMKKTDPKVALALLRSFVDLDQAAALAACPAPVRCINAAHPRATNTSGNRNVGADFDAVTIDGVGHFPMLEAPEAFNDRLRDVIEELTSGVGD